MTDLILEGSGGAFGKSGFTVGLAAAPDCIRVSSATAPEAEFAAAGEKFAAGDGTGVIESKVHSVTWSGRHRD